MIHRVKTLSYSALATFNKSTQDYSSNSPNSARLTTRRSAFGPRERTDMTTLSVKEIRAKQNVLFAELNPILVSYSRYFDTHGKQRKRLRRKYKITRRELDRIQALISEFSELNTQMESKSRRRKEQNVSPL